jgi:hypothetical protein
MGFGMVEAQFLLRKTILTQGGGNIDFVKEAFLFC